MTDSLRDVGAFAAAYQDFMLAMTAAVEAGESQLGDRAREHLGTDPAQLASAVAEFALTDHPNLQLALDAVLPDVEVVGISMAYGGMVAVGLRDVLAGRGMAGVIKEGPVQYSDVDVGDGGIVRCVSTGMYLASVEEAPVLLMVSRGESPFGRARLTVEVMSPVDGTTSTLLDALRAAMREHNVYRSKVISLHQHEDHSVSVKFHVPQNVAREALILPAGTLERLERQVLGIAEQAARLRSTHRHLKRGILLHGPPGTGKTLSVSYLLSAMPRRTTVLLTGRGLGLIEQALSIARELAPATVVFEDVDLVASERTMSFGHHDVLFELLNQMEGLEEDSDLVFLLTTNRPDIIEPALAARPGRIDLALELPLPDGSARRRMLELYAGDIELSSEDLDGLVERTEGVSGAFIKELMRQATLRAALDGRDGASARDVATVLEELLEERSALTRRLLGQPAPSGAETTSAGAADESMLRALGAAGVPLPEDIGFDEL